MDNKDLPPPPSTPKNILATATQLSREKTVLSLLPLSYFNLLVRPISIPEEVKAHMEAIEKFYVKQCGSEYDEMKKLANSISSMHNAEFADYDKWDEPFLDIMNRAEMMERLRPRVGIDVAPFLYDLLDQSTTTSCKLGTNKFSMLVSGDPVYVVNAMRIQANTLSV
uniref:Uncharacterized protein n=1 Tax=Cannabis sativa TaxID=3483 RepID=A0A803NN72_CANSA